MAVSSIKDFWIHPNALTITLNYFGDPQLIQTSMLAGAVIMAYRKDVISYDAAHNFREWKLQAFPTQLNDTCAYYVHAELSRSGDTAMIIYSPYKRDIQGRSFIDGAWDSTTSSSSWFIYLGTISASVDNDGATVERAWTDGFYTGTLDTDQQRMEEASGEWKTMFNYNYVIGQIEPLKPFSKIKVMGEAIFQSIAQFVNGLVIGKRTITDVAVSSDSGNESKVSDATLSTTGYVDNEIEALDDHFLIKDGDGHQEVGGDVSFGGGVSVAGEHSVGGSQFIGGGQSVEGEQEVKGLQTLHGGFITNNFSDVGGQITGAQLTQAGVFSVAGLKAMSFEVFELIYNKIRAVDGKLSLSSTGVIEHCEIVLLGSGLTITPEDFYAESSNYTVDDIDYLWLTFKEDDFNQGLLQFTHNDILYGYVNQIGESGQYARGGQSCMYVLSTNEEIADANAEKNGQRKMTIKVKLFADNITDENGNLIYDNQNQVVGNMSPTIGMSLAHRGNINGNYSERMTSFFIDSQSGNIVMLQNVMTPTIDKGHYGVVIGKLPTDLYLTFVKEFAQLRESDPVLYAKYAFLEHVIRIDHLGKAIPQERNTGEWNKDLAMLGGYESSSEYYDTVTYGGELWKCVVNGTKDIPSQGGGWLLLVAKGTDGKDGQDGKNGLSIPDNIIKNASFNILKTSGNQIGLPESFGYYNTTATFIKYALISKSSSGIGVNALSIITDGSYSSTDPIIWSGLNQPIDSLSPSTWYTLSYYIKAKDTNTIDNGYIALSQNLLRDTALEHYFDGVKNATIYPKLTSEWVRHYYTFKTPANPVSGGSIRLAVRGTIAASYIIAKIQLEVATNQESPKDALPSVWISNINDLTAPLKSTVFKRDTSKPSTPTGGSYSNPVPEGWSDGIPSGTGAVYSSSNTFYAGGESHGWSSPTLMADSADFDVQYSLKESPNNDPNSSDWTNEASSEAIWMATRNKKVGGSWSNWTITKIKGEDGISPYTISLDNDMDSVPLDSKGYPTSTASLVTKVELYKGTSPLTLTDVSSPDIHGFSKNVSKSATSATITYTPKSTETILSHNNATIHVTANDNGVTVVRDIVFTINGVKAGAEGEAAIIYKLRPSTNQIIRDKNDVLSEDEITFFVDKVEGSSVSDASDNSSLYLKINTDGAVSSKKGSLVKNVKVDTGTIKSYVKAELYDSNDTLLDSETIAVVKDGADGNDALTPEYNLIQNSGFNEFGEADENGNKPLLYWNTSLISRCSFKENAFNGSNAIVFTGSLYQDVPSLASGKDYVLSFWYNSPYEPQVIFTAESLSTGSVVSLDTGVNYSIQYSNNICTVTLPVASLYTKVTLKIKAVKYGDKFDIQWKSYNTSTGSTLRLSQPKLEMGSVATQYTKTISELSGIAGEAGPMAYPAGTWNNETQYKRTSKTVPFVYYEADKNYYYLIKDTAEGSGQSPTNSDYWEVFEQYEAIYTKLLIANWGFLGSSEGATFYDRFIFSQVGLDDDGKVGYYGEYQKDIFKDYDIDWEGTGKPITGKPDYGLSGKFVPNMFLDFYRGVAKFNIMGESFMKVIGSTVPIVVNPNECMNYQVDLLGDFYSFDSYEDITNPLMVLPDYEDWKNKGVAEGSHINVVATSNISYSRSWRGYITNETQKHHNVYLLICADKDIISDADSAGRPELPSCTLNDGGNWFIHRGTRAKFLMLTPGQNVKARLVLEGTSCLWYIENSSEFKYDSAIMFPSNRDFKGDYINGSYNGAASNDKAALGDPKVFASDANYFAWNSMASGEASKSSLGLLVPQYAFEGIFRYRYERETGVLPSGHSMLETMGLIVTRYSDGENFCTRVLGDLDTAAWEKGAEYLGTKA